MKHVYTLTFVALAFIAASIPQRTSAQCTCSSGLPATPITQSVTIAPTQASSLTFNFQQFNPAIGDLACVRLRDTISGISTSSALNSGPDSTAFLFQLTLASKITAPGITINKVFNKIYGYDTLSPYGVPGYKITYGPDNIFTNNSGTGATGGNASYIGVGSVGIVYTVSGGLITLDGGANDTTTIVTTIWGTLNLTYYWCPSIPLATSISNFSAFKKDKYVMLQWLAANNQSDINYEIEYSKNGNDYMPIGNVPANIATAGTVTQYQYQYNPSPADVGEIYFRIKRTDASGNINYSIIKTVNLSATQRIGIQTYPNPVTKTVMVQFDENQNGNFLLELVNITGQVIQRKAVSLSGTNFTKFDLDTHPISGLYFLRAKNTNNKEQFVNKVMIQ
ncbi:MAG: choice-of-anchor E domain-containing protein [Bacteroidetes bacterium]|nr:choice-of-anchor E domain-containing protein [Bacteroidota bacterium]